MVIPPVKRPTAPKSTIKQTPYKDTEGETVSSIEIAEMGILETEMSYVHPTIDRLREDIYNIAEIEGNPKPIFQLKKSKFATALPPEIIVTNEDPSINSNDGAEQPKAHVPGDPNNEVVLNTEMSMISKK